MTIKIEQYIEPLIELNKKTGESILEIYYKSRQFDVQSKADASPLTQADLIANEEIIEGLKQLTPDIPILTEESSNIDFAVRKKWQRYWLVDPLDGTKEFIRHSSDFTVNIALIENHFPILGMIYSPVLDEVFYAAKNRGAFKQTDTEKKSLQVEKITTPLRIAVGHFYKLEKVASLINYLPPHEFITIGSALKFCYIAEGKIDLYPRLGITYEWDTAAGQIIVEEAGGKVVDFKLEPLKYNTKDSLLNPHFFAVGDRKLLEMLNNY